MYTQTYCKAYFQFYTPRISGNIGAVISSELSAKTNQPLLHSHTEKINLTALLHNVSQDGIFVGGDCF